MVLPTAPGSEPPWLVGRSRERTIIRAQLDAALTGQGGLVVLSGEAGIGKTALAEDICRAASATGALVLTGHSYDHTNTPPYGPWSELLEQVRADPGRAGLNGVPEPRITGSSSQAALVDEMRGYLMAIARERPLVILLEDVHWADDASLELLRFVGRRLASVPILLLVTYRTDEVTRVHPLYRLLPVLVREALAVRIDLSPLGGDDVRQLIEHAYRLPADDAGRLAAYLQARAEGNPLFTSELLRTLESERVLVEQGSSWRLGDLLQLRVPPLLVQVIEGRLARLSDDARRLLEVAAVVGHAVPLALWQRVSGASDEAFADAIEQGLEAHLLAESHSGVMRFSHALVREALYQGIVPVRRRAWHNQVGEVLAETGSPDPDAVAHHFEEGGDPRAVEWLYRAAQRATQAYAIRTVVTRVEAMLRLQQAHGVEVVAPETLLIQLSTALQFTDPRAAVGHLDTALALAERAGDRPFAAVALAQRGYLRTALGEVRRGLIDLDKAVRSFDDLLTEDPAAFDRVEPRQRLSSYIDAPSVLRGLLGSRRDALVVFRALVGRLAEALALGEPVVDPIFGGMEAGDSRTTTAYVEVPGSGPRNSGNLAFGLAIAYSLLGRVAEAHRFYGYADHIFGATGANLMEVSFNANNELSFLHLPYEADRLRERRRLVTRAESTWAEAGDSVPGGLSARAQALPALVVEGAWREAREVAEVARRRLQDNYSWYRFGATATGASLAYAQGDRARVVAALSELVPDGPATEPGDTSLVAGLLMQRIAAEMALDAGDLSTARAWLEAHDRWLDWSGALLGQAEGALGWAAYYRAAGDCSRSRSRAEEALGHASDPRQPLALTAVHRFLGMLDTGDRRFANAEAHLRESLALADACAAPFERALTLLALAQLHATEGKPDEARALLADVRSICAPLEARPTLERADALEATLTDAPVARETRAPRPAGLTAREVEVLRLLAAGLSNTEIAGQLSLSPRTVNAHLTTVYGKLGVASRGGAIRFAFDNDLC